MLRFRPRLIDSLKGYTRADLRQDIGAGVTVGIVALPLAMAFGIASGVKPEQGIITAVIAGFLISLLGGSRVQIGGPAGAFVALLYAIGERYGLANLMLSTMMAGVLIFAMGALRLGRFIHLVPVPIITGFTCGIAVVIVLQQVRDFLGLAIEKMPANSLSQIGAIGSRIDTMNPQALALGVLALVTVVAWPKTYAQQAPGWRKWLSRAPGTVAALAICTLAASILSLEVETIGSRFGGIPQSLPALSLPAFEWATAQLLLAPTLAIAALGAIESLLCARVADAMIDERHDPNQELMAQGIANVVTPLFGGIAATGTIARTVTNVRAGARSPVAGIVHALTLALIVLIGAPLAAHIPLAALAGILLFVAWNMGEWRAFAELRRFTLHYRLLMVGTFALTVIFDLVVAIEVGLIAAGLLFIARIASVTRVEPIALAGEAASRFEAWRLFGSLFFGSVGRLEPLLDRKTSAREAVILDLHQMINLDTTGLDALRTFARQLRNQQTRLVLIAPNEQPLSLMTRSGFLDEIRGPEIFPDLPSALASLQAAPGVGRRELGSTRGDQAI
jgi:SulP family sulfate permease